MYLPKNSVTMFSKRWNSITDTDRKRKSKHGKNACSFFIQIGGKIMNILVNTVFFTAGRAIAFNVLLPAWYAVMKIIGV